jgi:hypothetical protein
MYSALRIERPAVLKKGTSEAATSAGEGKCFGLGTAGAEKRPINLFLIDAAAAPET